MHGGGDLARALRACGSTLAATKIFSPVPIRANVRADGRQAGPVQDRVSLRSKALVAALKQREKPPWRKHSRREIAEWLDPAGCGSRSTVYAWLWANMAQVANARRSMIGHNPMHWPAIAWIMDCEGIKESRGEPPNANSVRRVWGRVCRDFERHESPKEAARDLDGVREMHTPEVVQQPDAPQQWCLCRREGSEKFREAARRLLRCHSVCPAEGAFNMQRHQCVELVCSSVR